MTRSSRSAVLYIFHSDGSYTVSLETPTESPSVLAGTVAVSAEDRQDVLTALGGVMMAGAQLGPFDQEGLASVGRLMYGLFLPRSVQEFLNTWDGPLTISTNDPAIPWELLHDGGAFLGVKHAVGRRLIAARTPPSRATVWRERPAFLFIADPRGDLEGAAGEVRQLVTTLSRRGFPCDVLLSERASYLNVQEALGAGRYDVIHYAGHARLGRGDGEESALELAGDRVLPASQVERVLRGTPLVFLNACSSGDVLNEGRSESGADSQGTGPIPLALLGPAAESLASAFIFGGAQGFIGTLWPVHDAGSRVFAAHFYDRVLAGDPVGEALRATRQHLQRERPEEGTWASFVLYGDPTYRLWTGPAASQPVRAAVSAAPARGSGNALRPQPGRTRGGVAAGRSRLSSIVGTLVVVVVVGLLTAFGWWAAGRIPGDGGDRAMLPSTGQAVADPANTVPPVADEPAATDTAPPATSVPSPSPTVSPTLRSTATESSLASSLSGRLAFVSIPPPDGLSTLYVMNADHSDLREISLGADADWSPAGHRIAFAGLLEEEPGIHLIDPDGTGRTRITESSDWQPTWSPDGTRIAFMSIRDGNREVYVMKADGSGLRRISNNPWEDKHPSWSPAGDQIAFISNRTGRWQVWVMGADGGNQVRLTDNEFDNFRPVWSPDGTRIAYGVWTGVRNEIWVMDADGGNEHLVTGNAVYKQEFAGYGLAWEPNDFISFVSDRTGTPQIYAMKPDGSQQTAITDVPAGAFSPVWSLR